MSDAVRGLGIMGFWLFAAVLVVAIAWAVVRMAKIRQEALIRIAESGQGLDKDLIERILSPRHVPINKPYDPIRSGNEGAGFYFFIGFLPSHFFSPVVLDVMVRFRGFIGTYRLV